jgi:transcription elongation factor
MLIILVDMDCIHGVVPAPSSSRDSDRKIQRRERALNKRFNIGSASLAKALGVSAELKADFP